FNHNNELIVKVENAKNEKEKVHVDKASIKKLFESTSENASATCKYEPAHHAQIGLIIPTSVMTEAKNNINFKANLSYESSMPPLTKGKTLYAINENKPTDLLATAQKDAKKQQFRNTKVIEEAEKVFKIAPQNNTFSYNPHPYKVTDFPENPTNHTFYYYAYAAGIVSVVVGLCYCLYQRFK